MSKNDYIEAIVNYLDNEMLNYALLLDGDWGSGKTYFICNEVMKSEQLIKYEFIYISLYGESSLTDISGKLLSKMLPIVFPKKFKKTKNVFEKVSNENYYYPTFEMLFNKLSNAISTNSTSALEFILNYSLKSNVVFVIDDLERCTIPYNTILGYLNDIVEHYNYKMIIIANEKEIQSIENNENIELKYLVTLLNLKDSSTTNDSSILSKISDNSSPYKHSISSLSETTSNIFKNNLDYLQIKEKLIGLTIYYSPNFDEVIDNVIKSNKIHNLNSNIISYKGYIIDRFEFYKCNNNRTLKKILYFLNIIFNSVEYFVNFDNDDTSVRALEILIDSVIYSFIKYDIADINKLNYNNINHIELSTNTIRFKFVDNYLFSGYYSKDNIKTEFQEYINYLIEYSKIDDEALSFLVKNWYKYDDTIIENELIKVIDLLKKDKYASVTYPNIIITLIRLTNIGFDKRYINQSIKYMSSNIKNNKNRKLKDLNIYFLDIEKQEEINMFNSIIEEIKILSKNDITIRESITPILTKDIWTTDLAKYTERNKDIFEDCQKYLSFFDINKLKENLSKSTANDVYSFRKTLFIYRYINNNDEKEILIDLKDKINDLQSNCSEKVKKFNLVNLNDYLDNIINKLN